MIVNPYSSCVGISLNATPISIGHWEVPEGCTLFVKGDITARSPDGGTMSVRLIGNVERDTGSATANTAGQTLVFCKSSTATAWDLTLTASGSELVIEGVGEAARTIYWFMEAEILAAIEALFPV
jgi:hypothetical protein